MRRAALPTGVRFGEMPMRLQAVGAALQRILFVSIGTSGTVRLARHARTVALDLEPSPALVAELPDG